MIRRGTLLVAALMVLLSSISFAAESARERITLATYPELSPDGTELLFTWDGDIWSVPTKGGTAKRLTFHPAPDRMALYSPDGKEIAFNSSRDGASQVYVMPASGGIAERLTFHSQGNGLLGWYPDGKHLLTTSWRDNSPFNANRFFRVSREKGDPEEMLFDDYVGTGAVSPNGKQLLFTREGSERYRKGYFGSKAEQIWLYDFATKEFTPLLNDEVDRRYPTWKPDGSGFYYCGQETGVHNVWEYDFATKKTAQCTHFDDDAALYPALSKDGSVMVFRRLFDLYRFNPISKSQPEKIDIWRDTYADTPRVERKVFDTANEADFTTDSLEVAFASNYDIWVMDTVLREPRQVTNTPFVEKEPQFTADGKSIVFLRDEGRTVDVWRARPKDPSKYWWENTDFVLERVTTDGDWKTRLQVSRDGSKVAYIRGWDALWVCDLDGKNARKVVSTGWSELEHDWSPDGKWIVYDQMDADSSIDICIAPVDGHCPPYDLSRHPYGEGEPVWSPDGKMIAYTGSIWSSGKQELCLVRLTKDAVEPTSLDKKKKEARDKMEKERKGKGEPEKKAEPASGAVRIDFDDLQDRIQTIPVDGDLYGLFWSPDSNTLAFHAAMDGRGGTYTINVHDKDPKPAFLTDKSGSNPKWLKKDNQIVWLCDGRPASLKNKELTSYPFRVEGVADTAAKRRVGLGIAWQYMQHCFYDTNLNHRDWNAIYEKYAEEAAKAPSPAEYSIVMDMLFGELNASHMGFWSTERGWSFPDQWRMETAHLGVRFDPVFDGSGWKVRDVLPDGPADHDSSRIQPGETITEVDGAEVKKHTPPQDLLNGPLDRDVRLTVRDVEGKKRPVTIRPISYDAARQLLMRKWLADNEKMVDKLSDGKLGYLHIASMDDASLKKFEVQVFRKMVGKDGLVIDIRYNGGGNTTDRLLAMLCSPDFGKTLMHDGKVGYPRGWRPFVSLHKPIVVLCNQDCFSNAEMFTHAIKVLQRGKVVGVKTAGGVISTVSIDLMDIGGFRMPHLGVFTNDGEDMELHGGEPDYTVWPGIGEMPSGKDRQIEKGVEVLLQEVSDAKAKPAQKLIRASERERERR
jgi:tricorn protease